VGWLAPRRHAEQYLEGNLHGPYSRCRRGPAPDGGGHRAVLRYPKQPHELIAEDFSD
jgi:hypothetical protein